jgi:RNA polymerase sigma factor (sigma-70 family)
MAKLPPELLMQHLREFAGAHAPTDATDAELVRRFAAHHDEAAFAALLRRHGPMVLGVCRRVLRDWHAAEDAFQATFLVLARNAASIRQRGSVGSWLYGVARQVAVRAKVAAVRRREREKEAPSRPVTVPEADASWREVGAVLDEELGRLPERYRAPLVLCYLSGLTRDEAAQQLDWSLRTLQRRLERGRELLRGRLARRGLALSVALCAAALGQHLAAAVVPAGLAGATLNGALAFIGTRTGAAVSGQAAALADGFLKAVSLGRRKLVAALLVTACVLVAGFGLAAHQAFSAKAPSGADNEPASVDDPGGGPGAADREGLAERAMEPVKLGTLRGHQGSVNAVALSPDGKTLASAGDDQSEKLWDVEAGEERPRIRPGAPPRIVFSVAFSPDGQTLASAGNDSLIKLTDPTTGTATAFFRETVHVYALAFSPDGKFLASAGGHQRPNFDGPIRSFEDIPKDFDFIENGEVKVWDLTTKKARLFFRADVGRVTSVVFSPDGKTLATGGRDGTVRLWDTGTGQELPALREGAAQYVEAVAFSPDGKTLASAHQGRGELEDTVKLWDLGSRQVRARLRGYAGVVKSVAFSPDGTLATAAWVFPRDLKQEPFGEVRLWDAAAARPRGDPLTVAHLASSVAFGAGGKVLAAGGPRATGRNPSGRGEITLWDLAPRREATPGHRDRR